MGGGGGEGGGRGWRGWWAGGMGSGRIVDTVKKTVVHNQHNIQMG